MSYSSVVKDKSIDYTVNSNTSQYSYQTDGADENEKMTSDVIQYNGTRSLASSYTYDDDDNIPNKQYIYKMDGEDSVANLKNQYDSEGRITATGYDAYSVFYTYDSDGQLARVDIDYDTTVVYSYDSRGNITAKTEYDFTRDENITSSPIQTKTFTYANFGWKDQLIAVDGVELTYDEIGNVLTFGNRSFTWNTGRNLASITDGNNTYSYTYDENGIRTSKTVNGVTTYYNTKDGVILSQSDGTNTMYFQYDTSGTPFGFIFNGTQYFYMTNQMGDVFAITEADGEILCVYMYDEWGKLLGISCADDNDAQQVAVANSNPLRYRGYYYDSETEYYYLQSRYYDPSICRFINADIPEIAKVSKDYSAGTNLFAYCNNEPINNSDSTGRIAAHVTSALIGAIISVLTDILAQGLTYWFLHKFKIKGFKINVWSAVWSGIQGLVTGALMVSKLKRTGMVIASAIIGLVDGIVTSIMRKCFAITYTLISVVTNITIALIGGAGVGSKYFRKSFLKGGAYYYNGMRISSTSLLLSRPEVIRDFAKAIVAYLQGSLVTIISKTATGVFKV